MRRNIDTRKSVVCHHEPGFWLPMRRNIDTWKSVVCYQEPGSWLPIRRNIDHQRKSKLKLFLFTPSLFFAKRIQIIVTIASTIPDL